MFVTRGKKLVEIDRAKLDELISGYEKVFLDIGAGSGRFIYRLAKKNPSDYFIGLETSHDSLLDYARRIEKKPSRGGLPNVFYVIGSIESPPEDLLQIADEIFLNYPWTRLLKALVTGEASVLERISSLLSVEGVLNMTICYDEVYEPAFVEEYGLPKLSEEYIRTNMAAVYEAHGFELQSVETLNCDEMKKSLSGWGRKLAFGHERTAWWIRFLKRG